MKRLLAVTLLTFFSLTMTEALPLAAHTFVEVKCPKCKMKIQRKGGCPCCNKNKPASGAYIFDPCSGDDGSYTIQFDRVNAVEPTIVAVTTLFSRTATTAEAFFADGVTHEIPSPPPRR